MAVKALILFSGGLDSILAAKVLMDQKIKVEGITFKSYFFDAEQAQKAAKEIGLPLKVIDISKEHLKMVKNPKYGYGKAMNPCIDCHILMLKVARQMQKNKVRQAGNSFSFVATGDVLGERPMSQNKQALELIEKEAGLAGYLLRPLSAKLLKPTIPEKLGWVDREKLLDIRGRSRKRQIALAQKYKIKKYPTPAGGCLLTDLEFGKRLKELFKIYPKCDGNDIELLKLGRHFWQKLPNPGGTAQLRPVRNQRFLTGLRPASTQNRCENNWVKIIVGRNEEENKKIKKLKKKGDILIEMKNYPGPLTLVRIYGKRAIKNLAIEKAKKLTQYYSPKARFKKDIEFNLKLGYN